MAQLMPPPLTVSWFSKIQIGFTFLVPAHLGSPGRRAVKWVYTGYVCMLFFVYLFMLAICLIQPASARGIGICVINKWKDVPKQRPIIVQQYISRPLLINRNKFDLRLYVYVTSFDPLRLYLYDDGLVRFASSKYVGFLPQNKR